MDTRQQGEYDVHLYPPPAGANPDEGSLLRAVRDIPIDKNRIVTRAPEEPFRLTFTDVTCLVINRMIGTGIFSGPQTVMKGVTSPGIAILFWFCGCIYAFAGAHVYMEYGLNVPRYVIDGVEQSVPRSGGDLHYLQYVFSRPGYQKGTVLLSGVLFGISFICIGNMAGNCINCALRLMQAASPKKSEADFSQATIRGIAILIAIVPCLIHAFSRRGGILLNNTLAIIKVFILIFVIIATWVVAGKWSGIRGFQDGKSVSSTDTLGVYNEGNAYAQAFLSIVFAFSGFDQPNYVLREIKRPRTTYPRSLWWGVGIVSVLYMAVNICYMIIVPADVQVQNNVAQEFFDRIFNSNVQAKRTVNAFLAISSFGNIVVMTYTAARMKQEIAKQGFLPFASFFAKNTDVSLGRLLMWLEGGEGKPKDQPKGNRQQYGLQQGLNEPQGYNRQRTAGKQKAPSRFLRFLNPANHMEKTPVGALILHFLSCIVLIFATYNMSASDAYDNLSGLIAYLTTAWFGFFLALGILILHFRGPPATDPVQTPEHHKVPDQEPVRKSWDQMIRGTVNPKLGVVCACLYLVGNLYPVIMSWVPPTGPFMSASVAWYLVPLVSWCVLAFSALWFLGFVGVAKYRCRAGRKRFIYQVEPEFDWAEDPGSRKGPDSAGDLPAGESAAGKRRGGLILVHETIYRAWQGKETAELLSRQPGIPPSYALRPQPTQNFRPEQVIPGDDLANTDFDAFRRNRPHVQEQTEILPVPGPLHGPIQHQQSGPGQGQMQAFSLDGPASTVREGFSRDETVASDAAGESHDQEYGAAQRPQQQQLEEPVQWQRHPPLRKPVPLPVPAQGDDDFAGTDLAGFKRDRAHSQRPQFQ